MLYNTLWIVTVVVTALVQSAWPDFLKLQSVSPDLVLILVVYFAIAEGEERAMFTGALGGLYLDVASKVDLGQNVFCLVVVGYAAGRLSTRLVTEHPAVKAGLVLLAGIAQGILYTGIEYVQEPAVTPVVETVLTVVVPASFYTALITPLLYFGLGKMFGERITPQGSAA